MIIGVRFHVPTSQSSVYLQLGRTCVHLAGVITNPDPKGGSRWEQIPEISSCIMMLLQYKCTKNHEYEEKVFSVFLQIFVPTSLTDNTVLVRARGVILMSEHQDTWGEQLYLTENIRSWILYAEVSDGPFRVYILILNLLRLWLKFQNNRLQIDRNANLRVFRRGRRICR